MTTISLSKLDLSFLKKPEGGKPKSGHWRWSSKAQKFVTMREWHKLHPPSKKRGTVALPYFMPDVDAAYGGAWKSIIDGSEISSRPNWREHNKRNGVAQVDPDYWGKTDDHHITQIRDRMEFGAPVTSEDSVFSWKAPESAKVRKDGGKSSRRSRRKSA